MYSFNTMYNQNVYLHLCMYNLHANCMYISLQVLADAVLTISTPKRVKVCKAMQAAMTERSVKWHSGDECLSAVTQIALSFLQFMWMCS